MHRTLLDIRREAHGRRVSQLPLVSWYVWRRVLPPVDASDDVEKVQALCHGRFRVWDCQLAKKWCEHLWTMPLVCRKCRLCAT